jgi:hypothetical protein
VGVEPSIEKCHFVWAAIALSRLSNVVLMHGGLDARSHCGQVDATAKPSGGILGGGARVASYNSSSPTNAATFDFYTVDNILGNHSLGLLHLDVEGFEHQALLGSLASLAAAPAARVMYEVAHGGAVAEAAIPPLLTNLRYGQWDLGRPVEHNVAFSKVKLSAGSREALVNASKWRDAARRPRGRGRNRARPGDSRRPREGKQQKT